MPRSVLMFPAVTASGLANGRLMHPQHVGQNSLGEAAFSNHPDFGLGQFGVTVSFSPGVTISLYHIGHIFGLGSEAKMGGLDADGAVAGVEHREAVRGAVVDAIGSDVGANLAFPVKVKPSVSITCKHPASPVPALIRRWRIARHVPGESFCLGHSSGFLCNHFSQRIAVTVPPHVVDVAPSPPPHGAVALTDVASSHDKEYATSE